jgi:hypothetical protein
MLCQLFAQFWIKINIKNKTLGQPINFAKAPTWVWGEIK